MVLPHIGEKRTLSRAKLSRVSGDYDVIYQHEEPSPPRDASPYLYCTIPDRGWGDVRDRCRNNSTPAEEKQGQRKHSYYVKTSSGVTSGGIPNKIVDTPQPSPMVEIGEASPSHEGFQHAPYRTHLNHLSPVPQGKWEHTGKRDTRGTMEGSGGHIDTQIKVVVTSHVILHGFRSRRGTGTAIM